MLWSWGYAVVVILGLERGFWGHSRVLGIMEMGWMGLKIFGYELKFVSFPNAANL